ncbi:Ig-like domain-containing protein [Lactococcus lactis subsp. lactis]|uniref:Ig-like domain-containing protein n=1 Tax=Lactococcus lactis TaxID=1358 RepID=UPI00293FA79A|nr:Ig-like domain-containing protein [Lactococcus lactis]MDV4193139.1 Ig-like domain-containing protein [Lactococcus lactis subsp. lactis]
MDKTTASLVVGATQKLTATVAPDNAGDKTVTFSSNNLAVATVTPVQGTITAVAEGKATITATTSNGRTATCVVTVTA